MNLKTTDDSLIKDIQDGKYSNIENTYTIDINHDIISSTNGGLNGGKTTLSSTNNNGLDGGDGTKGTDAKLYGNGEGGHGGHGQGFVMNGVNGIEDGKTYTIDKDITIITKGGDGGYADGPDHKDGRTQAGHGGNGGGIIEEV